MAHTCTVSLVPLSRGALVHSCRSDCKNCTHSVGTVAPSAPRTSDVTTKRKMYSSRSGTPRRHPHHAFTMATLSSISSTGGCVVGSDCLLVVCDTKTSSTASVRASTASAPLNNSY